MVLPIRRVVTGQTPEGKSVFTHVEDVAPIEMGAGMSWYGVWGWDEQPTLPFFKDTPYVPRSVFPAAGGLRVNTVVFPPGYGVGPADGEKKARPAAPEEYRQLAAAQPHGGTHDLETGMHFTNSIDFGFISSGEISLELDDGAEVTLRTGDVYIQNGAVHAWRNRGTEPCALTFVILGSERV